MRPEHAPPRAATGVNAVERDCRRLVRRQALKAAGVSALPVAGVDLFINGKLLASTIEQISAAHGLAPGQLAQLPATLRNQVDDLTQEVGSYLIGRVITQGALFTALRAIGLRVGAQQAAKLAPIAGLAASAALSGWMFKRLCDRHIAQCQQVRAALPQLPAPAPVLALAPPVPG
ncbi:MAG: hypothetical protein H0W40_06820 [Methylibium sp.]|uniref:hypothetical protein n=1 Tax=Methylibium sp. TaxID=2067992 RepID=UPI00182C0D9A|nr:hypothetical protein [Methylibium sp.]MBA3597074.1 hypothetical protein [Methylibium sp.]